MATSVQNLFHFSASRHVRFELAQREDLGQDSAFGYGRGTLARVECETCPDHSKHAETGLSCRKLRTRTLGCDQSSQSQASGGSLNAKRLQSIGDAVFIVAREDGSYLAIGTDDVVGRAGHDSKCISDARLHSDIGNHGKGQVVLLVKGSDIGRRILDIDGDNLQALALESVKFGLQNGQFLTARRTSAEPEVNPCGLLPCE